MRLELSFSASLTHSDHQREASDFIFLMSEPFSQAPPTAKKYPTSTRTGFFSRSRAGCLVKVVGPQQPARCSRMAINKTAPYLCDQFLVTIATNLRWRERMTKLNLHCPRPGKPTITRPGLECSGDCNRQHLHPTTAS